MTTEGMVATKINPVIAVREKTDEPTVVLEGYLGTSDDTVVRLYHTLDTSAYVEIPKQEVLYLEHITTGESGAARVILSASTDVLGVSKHQGPAKDLQSIRELIEAGIPPFRGRPTFWTCARECEEAYVGRLVDAALNAQENPELFAQLEFFAQQVLLGCLTICIEIHGTPFYMLVPDPSVPNGKRFEPFSLGAYHGMIIARYQQ